MSLEKLDFAEPFFDVLYIYNEQKYQIVPRSIILNLSEEPIQIRHEMLGFLHSTILARITIENCERCLIVENFDKYDDKEALFSEIKRKWIIMYEITKAERHSGVQLYRSQKIKLGDDVEINMAYADEVPLHVGLHRLHWGGPPFREVHTQIIGFGRMQQFWEKDLSTLYREDCLAPGATHEPMCDEKGEYPWHQYEPFTKGIFMATEIGRASCRERVFGYV